MLGLGGPPPRRKRRGRTASLWSATPPYTYRGGDATTDDADDDTGPLLAAAPAAPAHPARTPALPGAAGGAGLGPLGAFANTVKCSVGAGILSFPYGFSVAGWLGGALAVVGTAVPVIYSLHLVCLARRLVLEDRIRAQAAHGLRADPGITDKEVRRRARASRDYLEYPDLAELAVGPWLRRLSACLVCLGQAGCCTAYVIFCANNLHSIFAGVAATAALPREVFVGLLFPVLVVLSCVRTLKGLMPVAVLGSVMLLAGIGVVAAGGLAQAHASGRALALPPMFGEGLVVFVGIALFAMESVTQIPALQASMKRPSKFPAVLNAAAGSLFVLYLAVGIGGATLFGAATDSVITRNMGATPLGNVARVLFVLMLLATFPFAMFPLAVITERALGGPGVAAAEVSHLDDVRLAEENGGDAARGGRRRAGGGAGSRCFRWAANFFVVRVVLCALCVGAGLAFSDFGTFLSLIGYPCMGTIGLVLPPLMLLTLDARSGKAAGRLDRTTRALCWTIMCVGAVVCLVGTVFSVAEVMKAQNHAAARAGSINADVPEAGASVGDGAALATEQAESSLGLGF